MTTTTFASPSTGAAGERAQRAERRDRRSGRGAGRAARVASLVANESAAYTALSAVTTALTQARAQIHALHALEASLLTMANDIASLMARDGKHTDHGEFAHRAVAAELAAAVRESDRAMARKLNQASVLVKDYPDVHNALAAGNISLGHTKAITDAGSIIAAANSDARAAFARTALDLAERDVVGRVIPLVKTLAEQYADRSLDERYEQARECRMVRVTELDDGMADLTATLPALYAHGIKDRLDQLAKKVKYAELKRADEARKAPASAGATDAASGRDVVVRSMDQIRADMLTDMLLVGDPHRIAAAGLTGVQSIRARVQVVVPQGRLSTQTTELGGVSKGCVDLGDATPTEPSCVRPSPATLEGYGPIDTETARIFAASASHWEYFTFTFDESAAGDVIQVDAYRPSVQQRKFLGARDQHCRFPGCRVPLARCEIDHTIDAALGGPTSTDNLAHLCVGHHGLKHHSAWKVQQEPDGTLRWTSPTGREYTETPPSRVRFRSLYASGQETPPRPPPQPDPGSPPQPDPGSPPRAESDQAHPF